MNDITQISGNIRPGNPALRALKSMLVHIGFKVTHPAVDESLFYEVESHPAWHYYDQEILFYESIAHSPFHIVYNDGEINEETGLQIAYAMLKNRPVLMTGAPEFAASLSPFLRDIIRKHLSHFHSMNLPELELTELSLLLGKMKPVEYSLSKNEQTLINARIRTHFRLLLNEAKEAQLDKARHFTRPISEN